MNPGYAHGHERNYDAQDTRAVYIAGELGW